MEISHLRMPNTVEVRDLQGVDKMKGNGKRAVTTIPLVGLLLIMFILIPGAGWAVKFDNWETRISTWMQDQVLKDKHFRQIDIFG